MSQVTQDVIFFFFALGDRLDLSCWQRMWRKEEDEVNKMGIKLERMRLPPALCHRAMCPNFCTGGL